MIETADSVNFATAKACIEGLAAVKTQAGAEKVHFFHTSGAKLFSSHTGIDATKPLSDMNDAIYDVQRAQRSPHAGMQAVLPLNPRIVDFADSLGVRSYIVVPPMVYGRGQGFGNKISIQIVALVKVSKALGKAFLVDRTQTSWVLCHVLDLCSLYTAILRRILQGNPPPSGKNGFYFAENGRFPWAALWKGIAARMLERNLFGVVDANPVQATSEDLVQMGGVLKQPPKFVPVSVAGRWVGCLSSGGPHGFGLISAHSFTQLLVKR